VNGSVRIREATAGELPAVLNVLDGALLDVAAPGVKRAIDGDDVLVAVGGDPAESGQRGPILGALVLDGREIIAVAVRRRRRDQGIGTRLVETASQRRDRLRAEFDERVRPFWDSLGFDVQRIEGSDRLRGRR
jgi:GNAT superfamily N-acetyltransferase